MEEIGLHKPPPLAPLQYQSADSQAAVLLRILAWMGLGVGVVRLLEGVMTIYAFGLMPGAGGLSPGVAWWYRSLGAVTAVAALTLGGLLLAASIGLLKRSDWATALLHFSETCALIFFILAALAGAIYLIAAAEGRLSSSVLYSLSYQLISGIGNLTYPVLALAILRWNGHH